MKYKTIIIANIAEAFEDALKMVSPESERVRKVQIEHNLCDRILLWEGDDKIVITPFSISKTLLNKNSEALGFKNIMNLYPEKVDINLCEAIMSDNNLMDKLSVIIRENTGIRISPYAVTQSFIKFVDSLKASGLEFSVLERPAKDSDWTVQFLDSKIGSRLEIDKIKDGSIHTPKSIVCRSKTEAIDVSKWFYNKGYSFVVKSNFGEGGWGTLIIKKDENNSWEKVLLKISESFKKDTIWNGSLIIVEEYITAQRGISSGCPSSELFLSDAGYKITYICDQVVTEEGNFLGVTLGKESLDEIIKNKIVASSNAVGKRFWELGYRGFFDIDFVLSEKEGIPYIIETNMRRTGGTHIFDTAKNIFGDDWESKAFILSQDSFEYGNTLLSENDIMKEIENILFPINNKKSGVIISIINKWKPTIGFIIVANSPKEAIEIHSKMKQLLK